MNSGSTFYPRQVNLLNTPDYSAFQVVPSCLFPILWLMRLNNKYYMNHSFCDIFVLQIVLPVII